MYVEKRFNVSAGCPGPGWASAEEARVVRRPTLVPAACVRISPSDSEAGIVKL